MSSLRLLRMLSARVGMILAFLMGAGSVSAQGEDLELVTSDNWWWLPESAAEHGAKVDTIFTMIFVVTMLVGVAVFAVLIYFLVKYRYQESRKAVFLHGSHRLEMMWTITPAVILVIMGIVSIRAWADIRMAGPAYGAEVTEVEVLARQFEWNIRYPGMDGKFATLDDIGTFDAEDPDKSIIVGKIVVPVGKMVRVHLMSRDVLHSFFVPNMRQKLDAVPGLRGTLTFTPTRTGKFDLMCAELCGPQHYAMQGAVFVLSQKEYDAWLKEKNDEVREILSYYEDTGDQEDGGGWDEEDDQEETDDGAAIEGWDDEEGDTEEGTEPEATDDGPAIEGWEDEETDDIESTDESPAEETQEKETAPEQPEDEKAPEEPKESKEEKEEEAKAGGDFPPVVSADTPKDAIVGRVIFSGGEVNQKTINPGVDAFCTKVHAVKPILDESIVAGAGGVLKNVFVKVSGGLPGQKWPVPADPVLLDQKGCHYEPHVFGIRAGQKLLVRNSDSTNHNVNGMAKKNDPFNFGQARAGMVETLVLTKPEDFEIKCNVHDWMNTWCHVMENPFFAVTDENGTFTIPGLAPGEYELTYWHESLGEQKSKVKLEAGQAAEAKLVTYEKSTRRRR